MEDLEANNSVSQNQIIVEEQPQNKWTENIENDPDLKHTIENDPLLQNLEADDPLIIEAQ